jgi:hypothetical protein
MTNIQKPEPVLIIQPKRVLTIIGAAGVILVIISFLSQCLRLFPGILFFHIPFQEYFVRDFIWEFDFNGQPNITIFFNVLTLNIAAILLFVIAFFKNTIKDSYRFHWTAMACIVWLFAIDNLAVIHRKIQLFFVEGNVVTGWLAYLWVILLIVILAVVYFRFWQHLDRQYKSLFLTAALLYFAGVLGREAIFYPAKEFIYSIFLTIEQALQYAGVAVLIYALLLYIPSFLPRFFVSTTDGKGITTNPDIK